MKKTTYIRNTYSMFKGKQKFSAWWIHIDESKTQVVVKRLRGFVVMKNIESLVKLKADSAIESLLFAKSKKDRLVGTTILEQLYEQKTKKKHSF